MFEGVKVFSATKQKERDELGETMTRWLDENLSKVQIVDKVVSQSSDSEYHCLSVIFFYNRRRP